MTQQPNDPHFRVTNNVVRETFNYIRDHKGCTRAQTMQALSDKGFNPNSVSSLIAQLLITKQVAKDGDAMTALLSEYRPIKSSELRENRKPRKKAVVQAQRMTSLEKAWAARRANAAARKAATAAQHIIAKEEPKQKYQPKEVAGIAALSTTSVPLVELTAEKILDTLGVRQAKVLYAELKKIFEE